MFSSTEEQKKALIQWYETEWKRRTEAVATNTGGSQLIDWVLAEDRITVTEILVEARKQGIQTTKMELLLWWRDNGPKKRRS